MSKNVTLRSSARSIAAIRSDSGPGVPHPDPPIAQPPNPSPAVGAANDDEGPGMSRALVSVG